MLGNASLRFLRISIALIHSAEVAGRARSEVTSERLLVMALESPTARIVATS